MRRRNLRSQTAEWASASAVRDVFANLRIETMLRKSEGVMGLVPNLSAHQVGVLQANLENLPFGGVDKLAGSRSAAILRVVCNGQDDVAEDAAWSAAWRGKKHILGLPEAGYDPERALAEFRHCVIAQEITADPKLWEDPTHALLYAGMWHALHAGLADTRTFPEPMITQEILAEVRSTFRDSIIKPLVRGGITLPRPYRLHVATATMQDGRDHLGADLAVVIGTRILGLDLYRIILFQAKKLDADGKVDVGSKDAGKQLLRLLSSGMGWYLFYPAPGKEKSFLVTARPASDVFADVCGDRRDQRYVGSYSYGSDKARAWDLPTFISVAMASANVSPGRLFPNADAAAAVLTAERPYPLAARVLAVDLTGALELGKFVSDLQSSGWKTDGVDVVPKPDGMSTSPGNGDTPRTRARPRRG